MKLFFLLARVPYPTEKGDKLRAFHQITHLSKHHEIIICALNEGVLHDDAIPVLSKYASAVHIIPISKPTIISNIARALFTGKPLQVGYYYNKSTQKIIHSLIKKYQPDHIFCQLIRNTLTIYQSTRPLITRMSSPLEWKAGWRHLLFSCVHS